MQVRGRPRLGFELLVDASEVSLRSTFIGRNARWEPRQLKTRLTPLNRGLEGLNHHWTSLTFNRRQCCLEAPLPGERYRPGRSGCRRLTGSDLIQLSR